MAENSPGPEAFTVDDREAGDRLDRVLSARFAGLSRSRFQAVIAQGGVTVDGRTISEARYRVKPGQRVAFTLPPLDPGGPEAEAIPLDVLYEDDHLIVIAKPAGLVVHPAAGNRTGTLVNALMAHCGASLSGIGGVRRPGIVHRLDKDTSGVMVVAKTDAAHRALAEQFAAHGRDGRLHRAYLALVWGAPQPPAGVISAPLGRHAGNRTRMAVVRTGGRRAVTRYATLETWNDRAGKPLASLVRCELETGRTHQIRVHMAHIGHPVLGDETYAAGFRASASRLGPAAREALETLARQALHAAELGFEHPESHLPLTFTSNLPDDINLLKENIKSGR